ncbi:unnamed protein product [Cylicocyclus nassatus]|uniref:DUF7808 domain-containing protein n=1 Tax=Cylicocyclus nassatus TaxID=53992 RepID=A0AA36MA86_CYLNA|nr:unnamed protein product [Cylicocyclus nassatus]
MHIILLFLVIVQVSSESVHWQWREIKCAAKDDKAQKASTPCSVALKETESGEARVAPLEPCFEEVVDGKLRSYCNVLCPGADTVYLIKREPQNHRQELLCALYIQNTTKGQRFLHVESREVSEGSRKIFVIIPLSSRCRTSNVQFTIRCEFDFGRAEFPTDDVVFANASRTAAP